MKLQSNLGIFNLLPQRGGFVHVWTIFVCFFLIYVFDRERDSERGNIKGGVREGEACFPPSKEPDEALDPRTMT